MLLNNLIGREVLKNTFIVTGFLIFVFSFDNLLKTFDKAIDGELVVNKVLTIFMFFLPISFSFIIPLAVFIAILITIGKMYSDQEFVVLVSAGYSPFRILGNIMKYMSVIILIMVGLTFFLIPKAVKVTFIIFEQIKNNLSLDIIAEDKFHKIDNNTYFIINSQNDEQGIFIYQESQNNDWQTNYITSNSVKQVLDKEKNRFFKLGYW